MFGFGWKDKRPMEARMRQAADLALAEGIIVDYWLTFTKGDPEPMLNVVMRDKTAFLAKYGLKGLERFPGNVRALEPADVVKAK